MADHPPTTTAAANDAQEAPSTEPRQPIDQPQDAVQMTEIESSGGGADNNNAATAAAASSRPDNEQETPSVPAKDAVPAAAQDGESSSQQAQTQSEQNKEKDGESTAQAQPAATATTKDRTDSLSIGPSDGAPLVAPSNPADGPVCNITLLLPTGARHPYRIDEKYLTKRNVEVPEQTEDGKKDPFSISVYKLKELILREWRDEWDGKPASPSSIRLIHFGKLLEDKELLKKYQFSAEAPNVVHMSVKPAEMLEEDEAAKGKNGGREGRNRDGGSGCCVIL